MKFDPNIAFYDSGQGGLTVWEAVKRKFPALNTVYLGDNARAPFGNKSSETITKYTSEAVFFLSSINSQLIIVACGTASSVAVSRLQNVFRCPIVGIVDSFCDEVQSMCRPSDLIAILGTRFTIKTGTIENKLRNLGFTNLWKQACPLWVPIVEEGIIDGDIANSLIHFYLDSIPKDVNAVLLACTHFPRLTKSIGLALESICQRPVILKQGLREQLLAVGPNSQNHKNPIYLFDSSNGITNVVSEFLDTFSNPDPFFSRKSHIFCTDAPSKFAEVGSYFTNFPISEVQKISLGVGESLGNTGV